MRPQATVEVEVVARDRRGVLRLVPAAQVAVRFADREIAGQVTDRRGRCRFRLPQDHYELTAVKQGYRLARQGLPLLKSKAFHRIELERVGPGGRQPEQGPGQGPNAGQGPARQKTNLHVNVVQVTGGRSLPMPDARVEVLWAGKLVASKQANKAGRATFRLNRDDYEIRVRQPGYRLGQSGVSLKQGNATRRIVLTKGESPKAGSPSPKRPTKATLRVQVVQRGLRGKVSPVSGARIGVFHGGRSTATAGTNKAGQATVRLGLGEYEIRVDKQGYHHHRQGLDFRRGDATVRIELREQEEEGAQKGREPGRELDRGPGREPGRSPGRFDIKRFQPIVR